MQAGEAVSFRFVSVGGGDAIGVGDGFTLAFGGVGNGLDVGTFRAIVAMGHPQLFEAAGDVVAGNCDVGVGVG